MKGLPRGLSGKESACQCKRRGFNPWVVNIAWRAWQLLQYSRLENPTDRGAWQATVHRVAKSQTRMTQVSTQNVCVLSCLNHIWLFATLWTVVCQTLLSMRFFRQEYWSGLPFPPPGNLPNPGTERVSYVFCFARQIIYHWATRQALKKRCIICIIGKCNRYLKSLGGQFAILSRSGQENLPYKVNFK